MNQYDIVKDKREEYFTVEEIIARFDEEYPNSMDAAVKIRRLKDIERLIQREVIMTHVLPFDFDKAAHFVDWGEESEMYVYAPYEDVYIYYMASRDAMSKNDTKRYTTYQTMYNNALITFQAAYNRIHMPIRSYPSDRENLRQAFADQIEAVKKAGEKEIEEIDAKSESYATKEEVNSANAEQDRRLEALDEGLFLQNADIHRVQSRVEILENANKVSSVNGMSGDVLVTLGSLDDDTNHRTVTDIEKEKWNNMGSYDGLTDRPSIGGVTLTGDMTMNELGGATKAQIDAEAEARITYDIELNRAITEVRGELAGKMEFYPVILEQNPLRFVHYEDGVGTQLNYEQLADKYRDEKYFLYCEYADITFIPSLPPVEDYQHDENLLEFSGVWNYGGEQRITSIKINSANEIKIDEFICASEDEVALKQDKLTAGANITIRDNVISASGGGGGTDYTGKCRIIGVGCEAYGKDADGNKVDYIEWMDISKRYENLNKNLYIDTSAMYSDGYLLLIDGNPYTYYESVGSGEKSEVIRVYGSDFITVEMVKIPIDDVISKYGHRIDDHFTYKFTGFKEGKYSIYSLIDHINDRISANKVYGCLVLMDIDNPYNIPELTVDDIGRTFESSTVTGSLSSSATHAYHNNLVVSSVFGKSTILRPYTKVEDDDGNVVDIVYGKQRVYEPDLPEGVILRHEDHGTYVLYDALNESKQDKSLEVIFTFDEDGNATCNVDCATIYDAWSSGRYINAYAMSDGMVLFTLNLVASDEDGAFFTNVIDVYEETTTSVSLYMSDEGIEVYEHSAGGGGELEDNRFIIHFTQMSTADGSSVTITESMTDIEQAYQDGKTLVMRNGDGQFYNLVSYTSFLKVFSRLLSDKVETISLSQYGGNTYNVYPLVTDVTINGTSNVYQGRASIPVADQSTLGVVKTSPSYGIRATSGGELRVNVATESDIDTSDSQKPIAPDKIPYAVKKALTGSSVTYSDADKTAVKNLLGISSGVSMMTVNIERFVNDDGSEDIITDTNAKAIYEAYQSDTIIRVKFIDHKKSDFITFDCRINSVEYNDGAYSVAVIADTEVGEGGVIDTYIIIGYDIYTDPVETIYVYDNYFGADAILGGIINGTY